MAGLLESGRRSQLPLGSRLFSNVGRANYADLQTSNFNAYGEAQYNYLTSNLNGIRGVSTGNFNSTNSNLNGVGQAQSAADVTSRFLPNHQGAAKNASMQPPPVLEEGSESSWIADAQLLLGFLTSQPEVPGTAYSNSSSKESASGMEGSAAHQIKETSSKKRESASGMKGSASYQMGEASNQKKIAIEVPVTTREAAAIADSQEGPGASAVQPRRNVGIPTALYDPMYERMGLPVDPFLRRFLELEKQKKDKNKDK